MIVQYVLNDDEVAEFFARLSKINFKKQ